jgi:hypothetical protein
MQPPAQPVSLTSAEPLSPTAIDWSAGFKPVIIAGILMCCAFFLPIGTINVIWIVLGGGLSVYLYNRRRPPYMQISTGTGAKLGAMTGLLGYALTAILTVIGFVIDGDKLWAQLDQQLRHQAGPSPDANMQQVFEIMKTAEGKATLAVLMLIFAFALFLGLATLGGAIASSMVRRDQHFNR